MYKTYSNTTQHFNIPVSDTLEQLMRKTMNTFPSNIGIGRDLALPFAPKARDSEDQFVKPLPSITEFDLTSIKLDLFKKYNPNIVSISDVENRRKYGHQYTEDTFKSLSGLNMIDDNDIKII